MKLLLITIVLFLSACAHLQSQGHEADSRKSWCAQRGGMVDYRLPDSSIVDCLTDDHAIEIDAAENWAQAIGLASKYADETGRDPGIALRIESPENEYQYLLQLLKEIQDSSKRWRVWIVEPGDFI